MRLWLIPMIYVGASVVCGLTLPRIEQEYLASYSLNLSVASAQAYLSAAASGMMALMGIVFAMAFVMVQFSAIAYSPRLVLWFARDHSLFHALGAFAATFIYSLFTLAWVDRGASGAVPLFSGVLVAIMLILSMLLFSRLVQRLTDLQVTSVLQLIGDKGREVIRSMFVRVDDAGMAAARNNDEGSRNARSGHPDADLFGRAARNRQDGYRRPRSASATGQRSHRDGVRGRRHPGRGHPAPAGSWRRSASWRKRS